MVRAAVFGKHPGWDDHIDDIGLTSEGLVRFKRMLYGQGIAACIESGRWDRLEPGERLDGFDHLCVWRTDGRGGGRDAGRSASMVVARIRSSRDRKGRGQYPLVTAIEVDGDDEADLAWAAVIADRIAAGCAAAETAEGVRGVVQGAERSARPRAIADDDAGGGDRVARLADRLEAGSGRDGFLRVVDHVEREWASYLWANRAATRERLGIPPRHMRAPIGGGSEVGAAAMGPWLRLMKALIDPSVPMMMISPTGRDWIDVIVGEPTAAQVACLRMGAGAIPLATEGGGALAAGIAERAAALIARADGESAGRGRAATGDSADGSGARTRSVAATVVIAVVLVAALVASLVVLMGAGKIEPEGDQGPRQAALVVRPLELPIESSAMQGAWAAQVNLGAREAGGAESDRLERVRECFKRAAAAVPTGLEAGGEAPAWMDDLNRELRASREARLRRVLRPWLAGVIDPAERGVGDDLLREVAEVGRLYERAAGTADAMIRAERLMRLGYGYDQRPHEQSRTIEELVAGVRERFREDPGVAAVFSPVLERAEELAAIARTVSTPVLLGVLRDRAKPAASVIAAWRRLDTRPDAIWPATADDLEVELASEGRLREEIESIPDAARRDELAELVREVRVRRLIRFVSFAAESSQIDAGFALLRRLGGAVDDRDPWLRYNAMLYELKAEFEAMEDGGAGAVRGMDAGRLRGMIEEFVRKARALPGGIAYRADVATTLAAMNRILDGEDPGVGVEWWKRIGPATAGTYEARREGDRLIYTARAGGGADATLEFVLVTPADGGAPFYIGAGEVSVAMAAAIHAAAGGNLARPAPPLTAILPEFDREDDPRVGPRSWVWARAAAGPTLAPAPDWLFWFGRPPRDEYPAGAVPPAPDPGSPLQHISPQAAVHIAAMAGCGLPTAAQWRAAVQAHAGGVMVEGRNVRDQTWARFAEHLRERERKFPSGRRADAGAFGLVQNRGERLDPRDEAAYPVDDGVLWFVPADAGATKADGGRAVHLLDNVSEYVLDSVEALPVDPRTAASRAFFDRHREAFGVAGASAISAPSVGLDAVRPCPLGDPREGYSDVGMRLVITGRYLGPAADSAPGRLSRVLTPTPYIRSR